MKKRDTFKTWPSIKSYIFCPILMKIGENDYLMRWLFSPSFKRIGLKMWIFYKWPIFKSVSFFYPQTLCLYWFWVSIKNPSTVRCHFWRLFAELSCRDAIFFHGANWWLWILILKQVEKKREKRLHSALSKSAKCNHLYMLIVTKGWTHCKYWLYRQLTVLISVMTVLDLHKFVTQTLWHVD